MAPLGIRFLAPSILLSLAQCAPTSTPRVIALPLKLGDGGATPFISMAVGTPPQQLMALFDTGSADLLVPKTDSNLCQVPTQQCSGTPFVSGSFDPGVSSATTKLDAKYQAQYANGETYQGNYVKATLSIGNATVPNVQFGLSTDGDVVGNPLFVIFGVGPSDGEFGETMYQNVPAQLKDSGTIKANVFSVYTNDFRSDTGSVVFGGIDNAKFQGDLQSVPLLTTNDGSLPQFVVDFSSMTLSFGNGTKSASESISLTPPDFLRPVLIDSGDPALDLPRSAIAKLAKALNTNINDDDSLGNVPCSLGPEGASLSFGLGKNSTAKIEVPLELLLIKQSETECYMVINGRPETGDDVPVLGSPFMQAAYIVFDMEKKQLSMAQAIMNATTSDVVEYTP